jgi:MMP 1-O-methyltransferase
MPDKKLETIINNVSGIMSESECLKLNNLARHSEDDILEIGAYKGRSTCCIASGTKHNLYSMDLWDLRNADFKPSKKVTSRGYFLTDTYKQFLDNISLFSLRNVISIKGDSKEIGKIWRINLGMLFIDGDHTYEGFLSDYSLFSKYVISGGFLAVHDYVIKPVATVIEEVIKPSGLWESFELTDSLWSAKRI